MVCNGPYPGLIANSTQASHCFSYALHNKIEDITTALLFSNAFDWINANMEIIFKIFAHLLAF